MEALKEPLTKQDAHYVPGESRNGAWENGIFDCFTYLVPNCLMASFCSCVSLAQIATRLGIIGKYANALAFFVGLELTMMVLGGIIKAVDDINGYDYYQNQHLKGLIALQVIIACLAGVKVSCIWALRQTTRKRFNIPGNCLEDGLLALCCSCCTIAQLATHVKSYTPGNCDFGAPAAAIHVLPGYEP